MLNRSLMVSIAAIAFAASAAQAEGGNKGRANTLWGIRSLVMDCWNPPRRSKGMSLTVTFSLKRNGELFGRPRVIYVQDHPDESVRRQLEMSLLAAFAECTPVPLTEGLSQAVAGQVLTMPFLNPRLYADPPED